MRRRSTVLPSNAGHRYRCNGRRLKKLRWSLLLCSSKLLLGVGKKHTTYTLAIDLAAVEMIASSERIFFAHEFDKCVTFRHHGYPVHWAAHVDHLGLFIIAFVEYLRQMSLAHVSRQIAHLQCFEINIMIVVKHGSNFEI
jgi:hypothetical protein